MSKKHSTRKQRRQFLDWLRELGPGDECVIWPWSDRAGEYGRIWVDGKRLGAHAWVYQEINGSLPSSSAKDGRKVGVCHHCDNPPCVRPSHLFPGEAKENLVDAAQKGRMNNHRILPLTLGDVSAIKSLLKDGASERSVGRAYGISQQTVSRIRRGQWSGLRFFSGA